MRIEVIGSLFKTFSLSPSFDTPSTQHIKIIFRYQPLKPKIFEKLMMNSGHRDKWVNRRDWTESVKSLVWLKNLWKAHNVYTKNWGWQLKTRKAEQNQKHYLHHKINVIKNLRYNLYSNFPALKNKKDCVLLFYYSFPISRCLSIGKCLTILCVEWKIRWERKKST
jgi:hypothetical protein